MRCLIPTLAATLLAAPALADSMPNMIPAHDVSGTYLIINRPGPQSLTVEYSKSANVLRVNTPQGGGYILYDFGTRDAKMVMPQMQRYMDETQMASQVAPMAPANGGASNNMSVTKGGTEAIAGHDCTDYTATDSIKGTTSTMCVTDDGIILSLLSSNGDKIVAQTISYAPVPDADVQLPPGYTKFTMPQMPAMGGMTPGAMSGMGNMPMPSAPSQ
jgi:Domain of unknown function (DUF4412)